MKIHFYEEFPTKNNLNKLKLINFPAELYIAAKSLKEFRKYEKQAKSINKKIKPGYWPILKPSEGYWLSPFSQRKAVNRILNELKNNTQPLTIMWDCELPFKHPYLFITQLPNFWKNKSVIKDFFKNAKKHKINLVTSEYGFSISTAEHLLRTLGVSFDIKKYPHKKITMYYTSMLNKIHLTKGMLTKVRDSHLKYKGKHMVALGTIATGILGNEPILKPEQLSRDIATMKHIGVKEIVIFRLGGLNKNYMKVIKKYI